MAGNCTRVQDPAHGPVVVDRWDREDLASVWDLPVLVEARGRLREGLLAAVFFVLLKADPRLVPEVEDPGLWAAVELVTELDATARLREFTVGDPLVAAEAAATLAELLEERVVQAVENAVQGDGQVDARTVPFGVADEVTEALEGAVEALAARDGVAAAWGLDPGDLKRLPVEERQALMAKLNDRRVRAIADLFGRMRDVAFGRPAHDGPGWGEVVDVELGDHLDAVVGSEWLGLAEPALEDVFLARLAAGELLQVETVDDEVSGGGGIVLCVDGSGSMSHDHDGFSREMWAQALKLMLLRVAREQRRPLHVIDFGSMDVFQHVPFVSSEDFAPDRILATAGAFYGAGTHFETPLREALRLVRAHPAERSDVVFVSDGQALVSKRFLAWYGERAAGLGVRTWGVMMGRGRGFPFAEAMLRVEDLAAGGEAADLLVHLG